MYNIDGTNVTTAIASASGTIFTIISENIYYQIVFGALTLIGLILNILYTIWKWYRKAKEDGKITIDEVDELMDDLHSIRKDGKDE